MREREREREELLLYVAMLVHSFVLSGSPIIMPDIMRFLFFFFNLNRGKRLQGTDIMSVSVN
jgi:hypothetical protein